MTGAIDWTDPAAVGARYDSEAARYPLLAAKVSRELYIRRNLRQAETPAAAPELGRAQSFAGSAFKRCQAEACRTGYWVDIWRSDRVACPHCGHVQDRRP